QRVTRHHEGADEVVEGEVVEDHQAGMLHGQTVDVPVEHGVVAHLVDREVGSTHPFEGVGTNRPHDVEVVLRGEPPAIHRGQHRGGVAGDPGLGGGDGGD